MFLFDSDKQDHLVDEPPYSSATGSKKMGPT